MQTTFCSFLSLPSLYDYGVKMPNFSFYGRCRYATTNLFSVQKFYPRRRRGILTTTCDLNVCTGFFSPPLSDLLVALS